MAGGVIDGESVSQGVTNPAFIFKNADDFTVNKLGLKDTSLVSGPILFDNTQRALNTLMTASGSTEATPGTAYGATANTINNGDSYQTALTKLANKFDPSTGHTHDGTAGEGPNISGPTLTNVPLRGYFQQGVDITGVTGGSSDISTQFSTKAVSSNSLTLGVVTNTPQNKAVIRNAADDTELKDVSGNIIYARITNSGGVGGTWTLTYFVEITGTETPYSFSSSTDVRFYYQELFNPMVSPPVYSELAFIPSDNVTADVLQATQTIFGKTILQNASSADVASSGTIGTANGRVANADHAHRGVSSAASFGGSPIYGDVVFKGLGGASVSQTGSEIDITATALTTNAPQSVGSTNSVGTGTLAAKDDHVHQGVHQITPFGGSALVGDLTMTNGKNISFGLAGQDITIIGSGFLRTQVASTTINDNQVSPSSLYTAAVATYCGLEISYTILRGPGNARTGKIFIATDGTTSDLSDQGGGIGLVGVTFTTDVNAGNVRLLYTSTNTGTAGTIRFEVKHITII